MTSSDLLPASVLKRKTVCPSWIEVARPNLLERGLLGMAEPILIAGGRAMDHSTEVFIGIDVAKARNAVAIAEGERVVKSGISVRSMGQRRACAAWLSGLRPSMRGRISATRPARPAMASIDSSPRSATAARLWYPR